MSVVTHGDIGFAIIILTIFVKLLLSPLSKKGIKSQVLMKKLEPQIKEIAKKYPNKEEQFKKNQELYKKNGTSQFDGCLVTLIQIPIIFSLYYAFRQGLVFDPNLLYSFVHIPKVINATFLGILNVHGTSIPLDIFTGIIQFLQGYLATPLVPKTEGSKTEEKTKQEIFTESMAMNVKYFLPIMVMGMAIFFKLSVAVMIYWITSNVFTIVQEWFVRRSLRSTTLIDTI